MNFLFVDGLTSFQLPTQNTVVLENNGTVGKRINASSDHQPDQGSLGATWGGPKIVENPLTLDLHKRVKRAVRISKCNLWSFVNVLFEIFQTGTTMGDVLFDLTSTQDSATTAKIGDVFDFTVTVDLPAITEATDVKMEIYGFDPTTGVGGFAICNTRQDSKGEQVTAPDPTPSSEYHTDFAAVVRGILLTYFQYYLHSFFFPLSFTARKKYFRLDWRGNFSGRFWG